MALEPLQERASAAGAHVERQEECAIGVKRRRAAADPSRGVFVLGEVVQHAPAAHLALNGGEALTIATANDGERRVIGVVGESLERRCHSRGKRHEHAHGPRIGARRCGHGEQELLARRGGEFERHAFGALRGERVGRRGSGRRLVAEVPERHPLRGEVETWGCARQPSAMTGDRREQERHGRGLSRSRWAVIDHRVRGIIGHHVGGHGRGVLVVGGRIELDGDVGRFAGVLVQDEVDEDGGGRLRQRRHRRACVAGRGRARILRRNRSEGQGARAPRREEEDEAEDPDGDEQGLGSHHRLLWRS